MSTVTLDVQQISTASRAPGNFVAQLLLACALSCSSFAYAEVSEVAPAPSAESEYELGKKALRGEDPSAALVRFKSALRLSEGDERTTWQMLLAVAVTYQKMDKPAFAIEYYKRFLKRSEDYREVLTGKWSNRRANAAQDIEALEMKTKATHGFVTLVSTPSGAAVFLDGVQAGADRDATTTFGMYVKAGRYALSLRLEGYKEVVRTIEVKEGKLVAFKETLESLRAPKAPQESVTKAPLPQASIASEDPALSAEIALGDEMRLGPWIVVGSGGALAVASVVLGVLAAGARSEWNAFSEDYVPQGDGKAISENSLRYDALRDETKGYELGVIISASAAVAALAGGLVWWALDSSEEPSEIQSALPDIHLLPTPRGAFGSARWRF